MWMKRIGISSFTARCNANPTGISTSCLDCGPSLPFITKRSKGPSELAPLSLGFSRQEHWSGLSFPSPMHESEKWKWSRSVVSDSSQPHGLQPIRFLCPWGFPGKSTGVGCHCLLWELDWNPPIYWMHKLFPLTLWSSHTPSPIKFLPINFIVSSYVVSLGCVHLVTSSSWMILLLVSTSGCDLEPPNITSDSKSKDVCLQVEGLWTGPPCDLKSLNS